MNDYTDMTEYYDALMTSGYYDYDAIAFSLHSVLEGRNKILELGVGTGLLAEKIIQYNPTCQFTGIDLTASMLAKAEKRLGEKVHLIQSDVTALELDEKFDAAFGNGGVWGFVNTGEDYILVSHLTGTEQNIKGLQCVARHLKEKALFIMSVQGMHKNIERELPNNIVYSQEVSDKGDYIEKDYFFKKGDFILAQQHNRFRLYRGPAIKDLMEEGGFEFQTITPDDRFHVYIKK